MGDMRSWCLAPPLLSATLAAGCCGASLSTAPAIQVGAEKPGAPIPGLAVCDRSSGGILHLAPSRPLTLFVHGCKDSGGRFRELAQVFEAHGQQTACFNYDHRSSLERSSGELVTTIEALKARLPKGRVTVLAHSQGGLVARRAFIREREDALRHDDGWSYRLLTVSAPFGGIKASSDCRKTWLHVVTLGVTVAVCNLIAGSNWDEIPPGSGFMTRPGSLVPEVDAVLKVVTDERGACQSPDGACKSDFVFSVGEQQNAAVDGDKRLEAVEVRAGHVEIVGGDGKVPAKLIALLQERGILAQTPPEKREEIALLLRRIYATPDDGNADE